jgi:hypothetical protein
MTSRRNERAERIDNKLAPPATHKPPLFSQTASPSLELSYPCPPATRFPSISLSGTDHRPSVAAPAVTARLRSMVRLGSCVRPAGESPVRVSAGAPGSRPRFRGEICGAERGVESLFGGSKRVGCDCSLDRVTIWEPSRSFHGEGHVRHVRSGIGVTGPGGVRGVARAHGLVVEQGRPVCPASSAKTARISRW